MKCGKEKRITNSKIQLESKKETKLLQGPLGQIAHARGLGVPFVLRSTISAPRSLIGFGSHLPHWTIRLALFRLARFTMLTRYLPCIKLDLHKTFKINIKQIESNKEINITKKERKSKWKGEP